MSDNQQISLHTKVSQAKCVSACLREADKRAIRQARTTKSTGRDRSTLAETEIETGPKPEARARGQANLKREQSESKARAVDKADEKTIDKATTRQ